jgi:hypothetical protein
MIISISKTPTFDVENLELLAVDVSGMCFLKSKDVYFFDGVFATFVNRSRVLRQEKEESKLVVSIFGAVIDAGFTGHLFWKLQLTADGFAKYQETQNLEAFAQYLTGCQQIMCWPSPAGNYYSGSNQTNLIHDITVQN